MTATQFVERSINVNNNSPIQDYDHLDDHAQSTYKVTPGFTPWTVLHLSNSWDPFQVTLVILGFLAIATLAGHPSHPSHPSPITLVILLVTLVTLAILVTLVT